MKSNAWKKSLSVVATAGLLASLLTGCASSGKEAAKEDKGAEQNTGKAKVVVWSHWGDKEFEALKSVAQEWATKTGNEVTVQVDKTEFQQYATTARSGKGPDVMFGIPHDNLGTFEKAGLLDPVQLLLDGLDLRRDPDLHSANGYDLRPLPLPDLVAELLPQPPLAFRRKQAAHVVPEPEID